KNAEAVEGAYETELSSTFAIRKIEFRGTQFLLNGEPLRLGGASPAEEPSEADLRFMKQAGMTLQAMTFPVSTRVRDWADENGLLILAETDFVFATPDSLEAVHSRSPVKPVFLREVRDPKTAAQILLAHPY